MSRKEEIISRLSTVLNEKYQSLALSAADIRSALMSDTKSSAGDKHETSRAMAHIELEKISVQLKATEAQIHLIQDPDKLSLVETDKAIFLVGLSFGRLENNGETIHCVSHSSPIGKALMEREKKSILINGTQYIILSRS